MFIQSCRRRNSLALFTAILVSTATLPLSAAVTPSGDYSPDQATWTTGTAVTFGVTGAGNLDVISDQTPLFSSFILGSASTATGTANFSGTSSQASRLGWSSIGDAGTGNITVQNQANISTGGVRFGVQSGSSGTGLVTGSSTLWRDTGNITSVGEYGSGTLTIENSAKMISTLSEIGHYSGSSGSVTVTSGNASAATAYDSAGWSTYGLSVGHGGTGTLNISNGGIVYSLFSAIGRDVGASGTVNIAGAGSQWLMDKSITTRGYITVGEYGNGQLNITNGGAISASSMTLAYYDGSSGKLVVSGSNSNLTLIASDGSNGVLKVGAKGTGIMAIRSGGTVNSNTGSINATQSIVNVDGTNSTWNMTGALTIGSYGTGRLIITNGGAVSAGSVTNGSSSLIMVDVGKGSSLNVGNGSGSFSSSGILRVAAAATINAGTYMPINAPSITSTTFQTFGGAWNPVTRQITVGAVSTGNAGTNVLAAHDRALITDVSSGRHVGLSFGAGSSPATANAALMDQDTINSLSTQLAAGESYEAGWNFIVTRALATTIPAYLSIEIGSGYDIDNLHVWHLDSASQTWSLYSPDDLNYDGQYANFTVSSFSGYAVTNVAPVPEPATLAMLSLAAAGLLARRKK